MNTRGIIVTLIGLAAAKMGPLHAALAEQTSDVDAIAMHLKAQDEGSTEAVDEFPRWQLDAAPDAAETPWRFRLNLYTWLPEIPVDVKLGPIDVASTVGLDELLEDLQFTLMADFEVRKGRFGAYFSPIVMFLEGKERFGPIKLKVDDDSLLVDFGLSYELGSWNLGKESAFPRVTVEPIAGARWLIDDFKIDIDPGPNLDPEITFITPVFGVRTRWELSDHWHLEIEGDYGGFGVDDIDETYNLLGAIGYRFNLKGTTTTVFAGYRYLYADYDKRADLQVDVRGPFVGIGFEF